MQQIRRVLLKLSGEALMGSQGYGIAPPFLARIAKEIQAVHQQNIQISLVIGGGNIFRGMSASAEGMNRTTADQIGMLATVINALAMREALEAIALKTEVFSALAMPQVAEQYTARRAIQAMERGSIALLAAGTGNPFFTTDTASSLRAVEIKADALVKATKVDGVYDADPVKNPAARRFDRLSYQDVLDRSLRVMDLTAITLCRENRLPVFVCSMVEEGALAKAFQSRGRGTWIEEINDGQ
ncbi:UMP kinase [Magnetococcales bacterium HHB-1]